MQRIRIRASSLGTMFDCPARWHATHIEGKSIPSNSKAALGTAIHAGTAVFDLERVLGQSPSISAAEDAAAEAIKNPREETIWEDSQSECLSIAASLTKKYCKAESLKHQFVAVEAACESLIITDLGIELTGTVDRVQVDNGLHGIADIKSGKQAVGADGKVKTSGHAAQMAVYELLAEHSTGLEMSLPASIIGLQTNKTEAIQRIGTGEISNAKEILFGEEGKQGLLEIASGFAHGTIPIFGNPKSMMCHQNYCPNFNTCFWRK